MATNVKFKNNGKGRLLANISSVATEFTLGSTQGNLFPAPAGGTYFYGTFTDSAGNIEIVKVEGRTADTMESVTRGQEGTTQRAWSAQDKFELRLTDQGLQDKIDQELTDAPAVGLLATPATVFQTGGSAVDFKPSNWKVQSPTGIITMAYTDEEILAYTPTAAITQPLPSTSVKKGKVYNILNLATTAGYNITLNSSGANLVWVVCPQNHCKIVALQDTPTTAAHWGMLDRGWPIWAEVSKTSSQDDINNPTKITFDTVIYDPSGMFDNGNDRYTPKVLGWWEVEYNLAFDPDAVMTVLGAAVYLNATEASGTAPINVNLPGVTDPLGPRNLISARGRIKTTAITDYLEVFFQQSGTVDIDPSLNAVNGMDDIIATRFFIRWMGP